MKFKITNVRLMKVSEDAKRNAGTHYVQVLVRNTANRRDKGWITMFDEEDVQDFEPYVNLAAEDGTDGFGNKKYKDSTLRDPNTQIPEEIMELEGMFVPTPFDDKGTMWVQVDPSTGQPIRRENGSYIMRRELSVFCQDYLNPDTGKRAWVKAWSPEDRISSMRGRLWMPLSEFEGTSRGVVLSHGEEPLINGGTAAPATTAQPAPATAATPTPTAAPAPAPAAQPTF